MEVPKHFSDPVLLPERILQFGTGILLRGLPDYFVHKANQLDIFNGRILVIKSTPGSVDEFSLQHNRFTTHIRGIEEGRTIEEDFINTSISRVISASEDWAEVLRSAKNKNIDIIISNTTEVGLQFIEESIFQSPPVSFPAKLTAFLHERFETLGDDSPFTVVIPTELIPGNGDLLKNAIARLSVYNKLPEDFAVWLRNKISFCNSLVDRIVTKPSAALKNSFVRPDPIAIQTEPYRLWAIEGDERIRKILSFAEADAGVIVTDDISHYRERKLRLLNGTHTISVCLGFLQGLTTVYECMQDRQMNDFISGALLDEIMPTLSGGSNEENLKFGQDVLDRFKNPFTEHRLLSITLQATAKMKMRNVPTFFRYAAKFGRSPNLLTRGFAAYLHFTKPVRHESGKYYGVHHGIDYPIQDDAAEYFYEQWKKPARRQFILSVCRNTQLWDADLTALPGFVREVNDHLEEFDGSAISK